MQPTTTWRMLTAAAAALLIAMLSAGQRLQAQEARPAAADERLWQGVFTAAQADRGKAAYGAYCVRCHGTQLEGGRQQLGRGPALGGDAFWLAWDRAQLGALLRKVSGQMPADAPASLRDDEYVDIVSYLLSFNGVPAGKTELSAKATDLDAIRIVQRAATQEVPNFALVEVVGCLAQVDGLWTLRQATSPVAVLDGAPLPPASDVTAAATGTGQFRLLGATPYRPGDAAGRRVLVRGLINRPGGEPLLDVLAVTPLGISCGS